MAESSRVILFGIKTHYKTVLATVLLPFPGSAAPEVWASAETPSTGLVNTRAAGRLELRWADDSRDLLVWSSRLEEAIEQQHGMDTDASLVHLQTDGVGGIVQGLTVDGDLHALTTPEVSTIETRSCFRV